MIYVKKITNMVSLRSYEWELNHLARIINLMLLNEINNLANPFDFIYKANNNTIQNNKSTVKK